MVTGIMILKKGEYIYLNKRNTFADVWNKYPNFGLLGEFYGGDLAGIIQKLDYLQNLGPIHKPNLRTYVQPMKPDTHMLHISIMQCPDSTNAVNTNTKALWRAFTSWTT